MDASLASLQARLTTFAATTTSKARRTSNRLKKAAPKSKSAWPHSSPSPQDLAFAGFVWKPTTTSPDNVQCFNCACQLDGWEEADVPAYEHLTHAPSCGFAIVTCIRLRNGDPGRTEDDPSSDAMVKARRDTFRDNWPLEHEPGYPNADQMAAAGWMFDPASDTPDGVTCPYCSLALDAWDAGDDPREEHRRRAEDCMFFTLSELYNPPRKPAKGKEKRVSAPGPSTTRGTRARKTSNASAVPQGTKGSARNPLVISTAPQETKRRAANTAVAPKVHQELRERRLSNASSSSSSSSLFAPTASSASKNENKVEKSIVENEKPRFKTRFSNTGKGKAAVPKIPLPKQDKGKKRASEAIEAETTPEAAGPSKRHRSSSFSSLPSGLPAGTPKKTPSRSAEKAPAWTPTDIEEFFGAQLVDAEDLAAMTEEEKNMTVEQWMLHNAKRGEEKLRRAMEMQMAAFDAEGRRAMAALEALETV